MTKPLTLREEVTVLLDAAGDEGITTKQITEFFPNINPNAVSAQISMLYSGGGYRRERVPDTRFYRYFRDAGAAPEKQKYKPRKQTEAGATHECEQLRQKVAELEEWKAEAIRRFPDLAVEPVIVQARQIVAKRLRANGDNSGAEAVLRGLRDATPIMQATVDALEWSA